MRNMRSSMIFLSVLALANRIAAASAYTQELCTTKVGTKSIKPVPTTTYALTITLTKDVLVTVTPMTTVTPRAVTTTRSTTTVVTVTTTAPTNTDTITTTVTGEERAIKSLQARTDLNPLIRYSNVDNHWDINANKYRDCWHNNNRQFTDIYHTGASRIYGHPARARLHAQGQGS